MTDVIFPNSVKTFGEYIFQSCDYLASIIIGNGVTDLGRCPVSLCNNFEVIYIYALTPPIVKKWNGVFANLPHTVYVRREALQAYKTHPDWKGLNIQPMDDDAYTTLFVDLPQNNNIVSYRLTVYQNGLQVAQLTLDDNGKILSRLPVSISATTATSNTKQATITLTDLQPGTDYTYTLDALDASGNIVDRHTGNFTTEADPVETALSTITSEGKKAVKYLHNGQLFIKANDRIYNPAGRLYKKTE